MKQITPRNMLVKLFSKEERHLVVETMKKCIDGWRSLIGQEYQLSTISLPKYRKNIWLKTRITGTGTNRTG